VRILAREETVLDPLITSVVRRAAVLPEAARVRELSGLSQHETSRAVGRSKTSCHNWEAGRWRPTANAAHEYVRLLVALARDLHDDGNYDPAVVDFLAIGERLDRLAARNGGAVA
jgi:DNA-binding transcriptional regulator YiaG